MPKRGREILDEIARLEDEKSEIEYQIAELEAELEELEEFDGDDDEEE